VRARRALAAAVALLAVLAPGCATVPESSDVQVLRSVPAGPQVPPPAGPTPGASPFRLVRDFIEATGSPADGHAAARAFLTRQAAASWDDGARLTVIEDSPDTPESGPVRGEGSSVVVRAARLGTLAVDGSFTADAGLSSVVLDLVREDGEWRISNPPPGVLVESTAFQQNYVTVSAWFVEPTAGTLVPDVRWVPAQPEDTLAGRALDVLLAGPSEALADAVVSAFPPGARSRSNVLVGPDGRISIDLAGMGAVGAQERRLAAAQIVSTLDGLVRRPPFQLLADGEPLVAGKPDWRAADIASYTATSGPRPDVPGLVVYGGRLRGLDGTPLPGPAGSGELRVLTAARSSPEGERLAAVATRQDGRLQLLVGTTGEGLTAVALDAVSMTRPTWRPSGNEVWTVINGTTVAGVALSDSAPAATYQVNAAELAEFGPITELRLSRDGVRVAAVVSGWLVVATVVSRPGEVSIQQPRVLRPNDVSPPVSVDWARSQQLVVASSEPVPQVSEVSVDGLVYRPMSSTNLTAPLAVVVAAPGRETVVSDQNGLWTYSPSQEVWEPLLGGIGPGAVPLYPG
jgi:hypothetical protein